MPDVKSLMLLPSSQDHIMIYLNSDSQEYVDLKNNCQIQGDWLVGE